MQPCVTKIAPCLQRGDSHFPCACIRQTREKSSALQEAEWHPALLRSSWQAGSGCLAPKAGFFFALGLSLYKRFLQIMFSFLLLLHSPILSLSRYFSPITRAETRKPSGFISGIGLGVEAAASDSQMTVWEKPAGVRALGLYGKLPPHITVLAGPVCCSGCCHPRSPGSSDERRQ